MATNNTVIALCFFLLSPASHCLQDGLTNAHSVFKGKAPECPNAMDIFPCTCQVVSNMFLDMNCSNVTSSEELRLIFNQPFPHTFFNKFIMEGNTGVDRMDEGTFGESKFSYVLISDGQLTEIGAKTFLGSTSALTELKIESNALVSFPFEELNQYRQLSDLSLFDNNIASVPPLESASLLSIRLSSNPLKVLRADIVQKLPELQIFSCSSCELTEVLTGTFVGVPTLRYVDIGYNKLTGLPVGAIDLNMGYSDLILENNQITNVSVGAIAGISDDFEIQFNKLEELFEDVWRPILENVTYFVAYRNPLLCGCDIAWIILNSDLMEKAGWDITCADGTYLSQLDPTFYEEMC